MNTTLGPSPASTTQVQRSAAAGTLQLRLANGAHQGRLVELKARKCSIGSGPQCTLRLRAAGIEPVHCLIDRSGQVTVVRRHAGTSLLNGQAFEQSPLGVGDRLQLGPLEFEVVLDTRPASIAASQAAPLDETPQWPQSSAGYDSKVDDPLRHLDARFTDLEQRMAELGRTLEASPATASVDETESQWERQREHLATQITDTVRSQLASELNAQLNAEVAAQVGSQVGARVAAEVGAQLGPQVAEVAAQLGQQLTVQLETELSSKLYSQLSTQLSAEALARINELIDQRLGERLDQRIAEQVDQRAGERIAQSNPELAARLSAELTEQFSRQLPDQIRQQLDAGLAVVSEQLGARISQQVDEMAAATRGELVGPLADDVAGRVLPDLLARLDERSSELASQVAETVQPRLVSQVTGQLAAEMDRSIQLRTAQLESTLSERLIGEISQQVSEDLAPRLTSDVSRRVASDVAPRVAAEVTAEVADRLSAQLVKETTSRVSDEVMPRVLAEVASQTGPELVQRVAGDVSVQVMSLVTSQLESETAAWEAARASWNERQQLFESELVEQCSAIDERLQGIVELQHQLEAQRAEQAQQSGPQPDPQLSQRIDELQQALAELRQQHAQWIEQRQRWQQTVDELRGELDQRGEKTRMQISKLESRWETFEHEQRHRQTDHENSTSEQISQRLAGIRAEREAFESERQHDRAGAHPGEHVRLMDQRLAEIHGRRTTRERQPQWPEDAVGSRSGDANFDDSSNSAENESHTASHAAQVQEEPINAENKSGVATLAQSKAQLAPSAETEPRVDETDDGPSADSLAGNAQALRIAADADDVNVEEAEEASAAPEVDDNDSPAGETVADDHSPLTTHSATSAHSSDADDDSIEAYMARLMQRVRSISSDGEPSSNAPAATSKSAAGVGMPQTPSETRPADLQPKVLRSEENQPASAPILDLSELAPRSLPAESTSNISAMRDLANMTARSAIDTHQRKRMSGVIYSKLAVAIAALMAAVALAWMSKDNNHVSYAAALVSMVIGVAWGLQYLLLSGSRWFQSTVSDSDASADSDEAAE